MAVVNLGLVSPADGTLEHECAEAHRGQDLAVVEDEAMIHRATAKLGRWLMFQFVRWTHHQRRRRVIMEMMECISLHGKAKN